MKVGKVISLEIEQLASDIPSYDAWGYQEGSRVNVESTGGSVQANEQLQVKIIGYEGGSYTAEPISYEGDEGVHGSKNDLINGNF